MTEQPASASPGQASLVAGYVLVLLLAVLLAVWGAFLVPVRVGGVPVPVGWAVAVVGNLALGRAGGRLLGRAGAAGPGLVWLVVALTFGTSRSEGDLVVPGTVPGLGFLLLGGIAAAVAFGGAPSRAAQN